MEFLIRAVPLLLLISSTLAQLDEYQSYEGYIHREPLHHQNLDEHQHGGEYDLDYHAHPKYSFDYSVKDPHTGDDKEHWETRDGDKVKGTYTILENDGTKRVVEYEADDKNGFNAVVHKIGTPREDKIEPHHYEPPRYQPPKYEQSKYEPLNHYEPKYESKNHYQHEFPQFDDGFVPMVGGYEH